MAEDAAPAMILEHLFLGSKAHARDRELLTRLRITHILNRELNMSSCFAREEHIESILALISLFACSKVQVTPPRTTDPAAGVPNFFEKDKSFTYRRCPIFDNKAEDISGVLEGCVAFMDQAKYYGRILVHCNKGVSRSTSMVVAYLMKIKDMSLDEALAFVTKRRPMANPNPSFRQQLQEYGQRLRRAAASKDKKSGAARVLRGPQGPSLPPRQREEDSASSTASNIGPQLPPHLMRRKCPSPSEEHLNGNIEDSGKDGDEKQEEKEEETSNPVAIGPSLPPSSSKRQQPQSNAASQSKVAIGPQLPPHLMRQEPPLLSKEKQQDERSAEQNGGEDRDGDEKQASRQDDEGEAANCVVIGPSLPPPSSKRQQLQDSESSSPRKKRKEES
ncbi:Phosphatase slingshot 2 protein, partial [Globisporangium splendens]